VHVTATVPERRLQIEDRDRLGVWTRSNETQSHCRAELATCHASLILALFRRLRTSCRHVQVNVTASPLACRWQCVIAPFHKCTDTPRSESATIRLTHGTCDASDSIVLCDVYSTVQYSNRVGSPALSQGKHPYLWSASPLPRHATPLPHHATVPVTTPRPQHTMPLHTTRCVKRSVHDPWLVPHPLPHSAVV
jgi:hypothetical protein